LRKGFIVPSLIARAAARALTFFSSYQEPAGAVDVYIEHKTKPADQRKGRCTFSSDFCRRAAYVSGAAIASVAAAAIATNSITASR
jgi:hypothetical protein